jgi:putative GTP pyrophosphokinase
MVRYGVVITVPLPLPPRDELESVYGEHHDAYDKLLYELQRRMSSALKNCGLRSTIKYRVKSFDSYYGKLLRMARTAPPDATSITITDVIALRVVCPFLEDVALAERCIRSQFKVDEVDRKGAEFSVREFGYVSVHCLIGVPEDLLESFHLSGPADCEVQIRTILQDAWAEVEHELVYKADFTPFEDTVQRKLAALNANLSLSDITFQEIRDYQRQLHGQLRKRRAGFWSMVSGALGEPQPGSGNADLLDTDGATFGVDPEISSGDAEERRSSGPHSEWGGAPGGLDSQLLGALQAHNEGDYARAIDVYSTILASAPRAFIKAIVHIHRGIALMASGKHAEALADFSSALDLDRTNLRPRFLRGTAYRMLGDLDHAEEEFTACLEADPYRVECLFQRAALFAHEKRHAEARTDCLRALQIDPDAKAVRELLDQLPEDPDD